MDTSFSLAGKQFLVTGGTRGIGRAISLQFAAAGAHVLANYVRRRADAQSLQDEADRLGYSLKTCRADITSEKGVLAIEQALDGFDLSCLGVVHCAATGVHQPIEALATRQFDRTFALNVRAFFVLVKRLRPRMGSGSSILALSSAGAMRAIPAYTLVGSSKGALESMARHMAAEFAPHGIRVNILAPGAIATEAWEAVPDREERLTEAAAETPIQRLASAEEVARSAQFLCSDAAAAVVGHTLVVDGGNHILV